MKHTAKSYFSQGCAWGKGGGGSSRGENLAVKDKLLVSNARLTRHTLAFGSVVASTDAAARAASRAGRGTSASLPSISTTANGRPWFQQRVTPPMFRQETNVVAISLILPPPSNPPTQLPFHLPPLLTFAEPSFSFLITFPPREEKKCPRLDSSQRLTFFTCSVQDFASHL